MQESEALDQARWEKKYGHVMSLYSEIRNQPGNLRVRRSRGGDVLADPIDFKIDVEIKAHRTLGAYNTYWMAVLEDPDSYPTLPKDLKQLLGMVFEASDMDREGHYKALFHKRG